MSRFAFEDLMPTEYCDRCGEPLEHSQIGLCDSCQDDEDASSEAE